jgi:hypothetical protein
MTQSSLKLENDMHDSELKSLQLALRLEAENMLMS